MTAPIISKDEFTHNAASGKVTPVYAELPMTAPDNLYERFSGKGSILLQSNKGPHSIARYSFICFEPFAEYAIKDSKETLTGMDSGLLKGKPLKTLRALINRYKQTLLPDLPPFQGGAAGLFSYDFVRYLERVPHDTKDDLNVPDAHIFYYDRLIAIDHKLNKAWAIAAPGARGHDTGTIDWGQQYDMAVTALDDIVKRVNEPSAASPSPAMTQESGIDIQHDVSHDDYTEMVNKAKVYIKAGDIFQANLSLRVSAHIGSVHPWQLYKTLKEINPSPFAGYLDFGDYVIASSSPERLVKVSGRQIETRPIAGTRPRVESDEDNVKMRQELLLNDKERAEHIMLIDLERNDMGRVCDYGSVHVDELMITEDYSHVIHIVSNIKGTLAEGKDMLDAMAATFPGGTITGVPKVRCMEIINELESLRRGPYTGAFGYMGYGGNMDMNIIIRTFTVKDGKAYVQAGAGIVADSVPEREYKESLRKAEALIETLRHCPS